MLQMTANQYEFAQYDFGRATTIKLYEEDKSTLFSETGYTGVIQSFKRHGDGSFFPFRDVARGLAVMGIGAQIIADVPIIFTVDNNTGTFTWTEALRPTVPGYMWLKAVLTKTSDNSTVSSKLLRVFVELGAPM